MTDTPRKEWMIWNGRAQVWWREDQCGYTRDLAEAGLYTKAEAEGYARREQESERPVHVSEHAEYLRRSLERIQVKGALVGTVGDLVRRIDGQDHAG